MSLPQQTKPNAVRSVAGHRDVRLHVPEFGNPDGWPMILIHGYAQSHLSWSRQFTGQLAQKFRLIVPDLRGHGMSDKPNDAGAYNTSQPWADDLAAIIAQLGLAQPLAVGWSMGGKVIADYLRHHGDNALAGFALIGASMTTGSFQPKAASAHIQQDHDVVASGMYSDDLDTNLRATAAFVRACTHHPIDADSAAWMLGFNMLCPPHVRAACRQRHEDYTADLAKVSKPVLILTGAHDRMCTMPLVDEAKAALPHAGVTLYADSGHATFWEEPDRFDTDLAAFAATCLPDSQ